jgi:hypothetical protein
MKGKECSAKNCGQDATNATINKPQEGLKTIFKH